MACSLDMALGEREEVCAKHGPFTSSGVRYGGFHEVWTRCPACEEERLAAERQAEALRSAEQARWALESALGEACIPARFIGRTFDSFKADTQAQREALRAACAFAQNFAEHARRGDGLIFSGLPGTGKSHLAAAILQALMPERVGLYTTAMNVIRTVRGTWRRDSERSESEVLAIYSRAPLLVVDEIGMQYGTEGEQTILFDVIDRRYRDMRPTILLTNQDKRGFREFVGERSFDRLVETARWVAFDWPSYRAQARKEAA